MMPTQLITGGVHQDDRGSIAFVNDFDMTPVKRFYRIAPKSTDIVRAWQGHQKEAKWFHCIKGQFKIRLIQPNDWTTPDSNLLGETLILSGDESNVLYVPGGYVNGFQALEEGSILLVFSDKTTEESIGDDFRFDLDYWTF